MFLFTFYNIYAKLCLNRESGCTSKDLTKKWEILNSCKRRLRWGIFFIVLVGVFFAEDLVVAKFGIPLIHEVLDKG